MGVSTPGLTPPPPGTPPSSPVGIEVVQGAAIEGVPPRYEYIDTPLPNAPSFNVDANDENHKHNQNSIPDLLSGEEISIG